MTTKTRNDAVVLFIQCSFTHFCYKIMGLDVILFRSIYPKDSARKYKADVDMIVSSMAVARLIALCSVKKVPRRIIVLVCSALLSVGSLLTCFSGTPTSIQAIMVILMGSGISFLEPSIFIFLAKHYESSPFICSLIIMSGTTFELFFSILVFFEALDSSAFYTTYQRFYLAVNIAILVLVLYMTGDLKKGIDVSQSVHPNDDEMEATHDEQATEDQKLVSSPSESSEVRTEVRTSKKT